MRDKKYRTYTDEFKREALELLKSSGKSARQIEAGIGDHGGDAAEMARAIPGGTPETSSEASWSRVIWKRPNERSSA